MVEPNPVVCMLSTAKPRKIRIQWWRYQRSLWSGLDHGSQFPRAFAKGHLLSWLAGSFCPVSIPFYCKELSQVCRKVIDQRDYQFQPCFRSWTPLVWWEQEIERGGGGEGFEELCRAWHCIWGNGEKFKRLWAMHLRELREIQETPGSGMQLFGKGSDSGDWSPS